MSTFVVPDVHGNRKAVEDLLKSQDILSEDGLRIDRETTVVQLGDLCNCVAASVNQDLECLERAEEWFDVYLVGNHELGHFAMKDAFWGFWPYKEIEIELRALAAKGFLLAAHVVDGILITHAGISRGWEHLFQDADAERAGEWLNTQWRQGRYDMNIFSAVGRSRGGLYEEGGILWSDWSEPKSNLFRQVVGHTVGEGVRVRPEDISPDRALHEDWTAICIDLGGGRSNSAIVGAWIRDGAIELVGG